MSIDIGYSISSSVDGAIFRHCSSIQEAREALDILEQKLHNICDNDKDA